MKTISCKHTESGFTSITADERSKKWGKVEKAAKLEDAKQADPEDSQAIKEANVFTRMQIKQKKTSHQRAICESQLFPHHCYVRGNTTARRHPMQIRTVRFKNHSRSWFMGGRFLSHEHHQEQMFEPLSRLTKCKRSGHSPAFPLGFGAGRGLGTAAVLHRGVPRPVGLPVTRGFDQRPSLPRSFPCPQPWERNLGTLQARATSAPQEAGSRKPPSL